MEFDVGFFDGHGEAPPPRIILREACWPEATKRYRDRVRRPIVGEWPDLPEIMVAWPPTSGLRMADPSDGGESALYDPIKAFLESQGYEVKGEVQDCDVVGMRGDEPPVIVELKQRFNLELIVQGVERQRLSNQVYLAFPAPGRKSQTLWNKKQRSVMALCRRLGLGVLLVHQPKKRKHWVEPRLDPGPYKPRPDTRGRGRLLREFQRRVGDPNKGGTNKRQVMTAYRQGALLCAHELRDGPLKLAEVRKRTEVAEASQIVPRNFYGWFEKLELGVYGLTEAGRNALEEYADMLELLADRPE